MIELIPWATLDLNNQLHLEDGTTRPLSTSDIRFVRGKFAGSLLSEVDDIRYLEWAITANDDNYFIEASFTLRVNELS